MRILKNSSPLVVLLAFAAAGMNAQTVKATLNYPNGVAGVAVDYLRNRAYVLLPGFYSDGTNAVQVLKSSNSSVISTFPVPVSNGIAVNLATGTVYVAGVESANNDTGIESVVVAVNPTNGSITATIPVTSTVGPGIVALAVDPITDRVFVSNDSDNTVVEINGKTNTVTASVSLDGQTPAGVAINYATEEVYAALNDSSVAIISERDNSVKYASYGVETSAVAVDFLTNQTYVTDIGSAPGTVGVLSGSGSTEASIPVGFFPLGIDVDFVTHSIFVANESDGTVSKINGKSNTVVSTTTVPANSVAVNPADSTFYAVGSTTVTVLTEN